MAGEGAAPAGPSRIQNGAWLTYASMLLMMLVGGTIYGFGQWSSVLKEQDGYGLNQMEVEFLALCGHFGNYVLLDSGLIISRYGTIVGFTLGCSYACLGYFGMWLSLTRYSGQLPIWVLACFCVLYGHGCGTVDNATMNELMSNFPAYKGYAVGTTKSFYGLGAAVVVTIHQAAFPSNETGCLLFLSIYCLAAGIFLIPIIFCSRGLVDEPRSAVVFKFKVTAGAVVTFALMFFVVNYNAQALSHRAWTVVLVLVICGAFAPFLLVIPTKKSLDERRLSGPSFILPTINSPNLSVTGVLVSLNFWALMIVLLLAHGAGLMLIGNAPQIQSAFVGKAMPASGFVALVSIANCCGRLFTGFCAEALASRINRPWFLTLATSLLATGYVLLYQFEGRVLWIAAAILGFAYGNLWGVQPALVQELFGPVDFGLKLAFTTLASLGGSFIFSTLLAGELYDQEEHRLGTAGCFQPSCFSTAFHYTAITSCIAVVLSALLALKTRNIYKESEGRSFAHQPRQVHREGVELEDVSESFAH